MQFNRSQSAVVLGAGSWGTALAITLSEFFDTVTLVGRDHEQCTEINNHHTNTNYLPRINLPGNVKASTDYAVAQSASIILFVVPTSATRVAAAKLQEIGIPNNITRQVDARQIISVGMMIINLGALLMVATYECYSIKKL